MAESTEEVIDTEEKTTDEGTSNDTELIDQIDKAIRESESPKSDAQVTSEHADNDKTEKAKPDEKPEKPEPEWYDEILAEAKEHGLNKRQVKKFSSRADYDHAINLIEKMKGQEDARKEVQGKEEVQKEEPENEQKAGYKVQLDKELYDEDLISEFGRMRDHYEERLAALEQMVSQSEQASEEQAFDGIIDSLGHSDLFGETGEEDEDELERRKEVYSEVLAYIAGKEAGGQRVKMNKDVVARTVRSLFYDDLVKKEIRSRTQKLSRQSNGRQGGSPTRTNDMPREDPREEFDRMYRELSGN